MIPLVAGLEAVGVRALLSFAARELADAAWAWAKRKVVIHIASKAADWLEDTWDWVLEKLTGKRPSAWKADQGLELATLESIEAVSGRSIEDIIRTDILDTPAGRAIIDRWHNALYRLSGQRDAAIKWHVDTAPIPLDLSITDWAKSIAQMVDMTVDEVIERRLSHS